MTLYLIGLGLSDEKDITLNGQEALQQCKQIYLEGYTSILQTTLANLEKQYKKKIVLVGREFVENHSDELMQKAKKENLALLIVGDPLAATTHYDLFLEARKQQISVKVIHNATILSAVALTGLQLYKFGKTASIPFPRKEVSLEAPYLILNENQSINAHTLFLLDLVPSENKFLTIPQAIQVMLDIEMSEIAKISEHAQEHARGFSHAVLDTKKKNKLFNEHTLCLGCARLGSPDFCIRSGTAKEMLKQDFGRPPYCLIVPSKKLHFLEEEAIESWKII